MSIHKTALTVLAAVLLLAANLRVVYTVSVAGEALPGTFSAEQLRQGEAAARAAAEEIVRSSDTECAAARKTPRLAFSPPDGDVSALARTLLAHTAGVGDAWRVLVGGTDVGGTSDPTALGEVLEVLLAGGAVREAVSAQFTQEITLRRVFVPEGVEYDLMALARAIRGATEVMSVTADGTVRYG